MHQAVLQHSSMCWTNKYSCCDTFS